MKRILFTAAILAAITLPSFAGTEMASGKDMKDVKQIAPPPQASDAGFYLAAFGGANFDTWYGDNRQTLTTGGTTVFNTNSRLSSGWGGAGGIKIGYNFQSFDAGFIMLQPAVEVEGIYINDPASASFFSGTEKITTNSGDFFLNGILRFKNKSIITPYIGVGIGLQYVTEHADFSTAGFHETGLDTSDLDLAGQGLVGFDVKITEHLSLFSEYKFIDAIGNDGHSHGPGIPSNSTYRFKPDQIEQNLVTAGIKYTF